METKEINIVAPQGYEIDKENSTFECIKFKPVQKRWKDNANATITGYLIGIQTSDIYKVSDILNIPSNYNVFATNKQARSALAMARISQIMANDERFGGVVTDEEWNERTVKYVIYRTSDKITKGNFNYTDNFLAFHTAEERDLFLQENEDLIKEYLMLD